MRLLHASQIKDRVPDAFDRIDILETIGSTNDHLKAAPLPDAGRWHLALAETQTAGRGRGDNAWLSPRGAGLWMSAAHTFNAVPERLSSFTLVVGLTVAAALASLGLRRVRLKWPNDLVVDDRKLGGILVESVNNGRTAICGIGINVALPNVETLSFETALRPIDLATALGDAPDRSRLAATIGTRLVAAAERFVNDGFAPFAKAWPQYDWLLGREVEVSGVTPAVMGVADGIGENGELMLRKDGAKVPIVAGSVRPIDTAPTDPGDST